MSVHNTIIPVVAKGDFPKPIIRRMPYKSNLKELEDYRKAAPKENRAMIEKLTELYYNKKIPNYKTVENVVTRLLTKTKNLSIQAKAVREFDKIIKQILRRYADNRPYRTTNPRKKKEGFEQSPKHNPDPL